MTEKNVYRIGYEVIYTGSVTVLAEDADEAEEIFNESMMNPSNKFDVPQPGDDCHTSNEPPELLHGEEEADLE